MAKIKKINVNSTAYDLDATYLGGVSADEWSKRGIYYIKGTGTTAGTWLGSHTGITAYYDGLTIAYHTNIAGASTTTLNINGLGAKTCYLRADSKVTTHYGINTVVIFTYITVNGTGRWETADYDANSYAYVRQYVESANSELPIVLSHDTEIPSSYKTKYTGLVSGVTINPSTKTIKVSKTVDSVTHTSTLGPTSGTIDGKNIATENYVDNSISAVVNSAPEAFDTLKEIADWIEGEGEAASAIVNHTHTVTPTATITAPSFTGTSAKSAGINETSVSVANGTHKHTVTATGTVAISTGTGTANYTPSGTVSKPTFTGTEADTTSISGTQTVASSTHTHKYTPEGGVTISTGTGTANYTPSGSVSKPSFTGTKATISTTYTPVGTVSAGLSATPTFTGTDATSGAPGSTQKTSVAVADHTHTVSVPTSASFSIGTGTANYTPAGTVSKPTFTGDSVASGGPSSTTTIYSITGTGSLPNWYGTYTSSSQTLAFTFSKGSLPTRSSAISMPGTNHTHTTKATGTVSQPTFTGTGKQFVISLTNGSKTTNAETQDSVDVPTMSHTHTVKATGTVSKPGITASFTGTEATISTEYTPGGSVSQPTFTGTGVQLVGTFAGTEASTTSISGTKSVASSSHTHKYTPAGTVSQPTFTGTGVELKATFTGTSATTNATSDKVSVAPATHTHNVTATGTVGKPGVTFNSVSTSTPR